MSSSQKFSNEFSIFLKKYGNILLDIVFVLLAFYLVWVLYGLSKIVSPKLDSELKVNLMLASLILASITFVFAFLKNYFVKRFSKQQKPWIWLTIYCMIWTLVLGAVFIDTKFNSNEINLVLREYYNDNGTVMGNLSCAPNSGKYLIYGELVLCTPQPELYNGTKEVIFYFRNGTTTKEEIKYSFAFRTPEDTTAIGFQLAGFDLNQKYHSLLVTRNVNFIAPEEKEKYEDRLITLYIWLMGVVFLIPTMMNNMKNLWAEH